ncbi:acetyltransferase [Clostridium sp. BJN0013]|uniref:acetyltransferase n=1 Tax=Clostridium sp. BJN0013 TaxID=3236840 RepID=UPI0034C5FE4F
MEKIILIGAGGHCRSIIDSINGLNNFQIIGIVDKKHRNHSRLDIDRVWCDEDLDSLYKSGIKNAFIGIGSTAYPEIRIKFYNLLKSIGYNFPIIIDKTAIVSCSAKIEEGVFIGKGAIVNANALIKKQCIINSGAIVEHDCKINEFVHLAPGATLSGGVSIGQGTHVGTNATIIQNINVGKNVLIGAGSVIVKNVKDGIKVYGNPGREVECYE